MKFFQVLLACCVFTVMAQEAAEEAAQGPYCKWYGQMCGGFAGDQCCGFLQCRYLQFADYGYCRFSWFGARGGGASGSTPASTD